ncbi:flavodoxin family protein [Halobacillus sp. BBL2006]|uniref:flavodoxin family protein n=1 Tax=Halobacillus sp. BBL2006 TaxID=1543706 RepID=UPI00054336AF|nr:flavodoxin family protein [Halobacillus sp. BBL2006]KHE68190.1 BRAMP protein [Halobacillus sp. BBL2006]
MSRVKALFLNASLKSSENPSNTEALWKEVEKIYEREDVTYESIRLADYYLPYGISKDLGEGDEWPYIFEKIKEADIVVLGTPLWLGEKSSIATKVLERMYGSSGETNDYGQAVYYNKVAGVVITGNEDGAKNAAQSILYRMSHIGFVIPPNVDAYWVGEAGPGPSFIEANGIENDFTKNHIEMLAYNTVHLAKIFKEQPIPAIGNTQE